MNAKLKYLGSKNLSISVPFLHYTLLVLGLHLRTLISRNLNSFE
jgi:hypothetical protein